MGQTPQVLEGLDFTEPVVDLVDEVIDRLCTQWESTHDGQMNDEVFTRIAAKADSLVTGRLL